MEITEIRVKLMEHRSEKLQAFCTVTIDSCFVIRDLKIIEGQRGPFVAMPSRKLTDRCPKCSGKNHLRAHYCSECGCRLDPDRVARDEGGRTRLHTDVAHPINAACRQKMEEAILRAFAEEIERSKRPGYRPTDLGADYDEEYGFGQGQPPDLERADPGRHSLPVGEATGTRTADLRGGERGPGAGRELAEGGLGG